jgi:hypothetical protein
VDPDTHIDSIDQAEGAVLEGTANWSAKIAVTGIPMQISIFCPPTLPTEIRAICRNDRDLKKKQKQKNVTCILLLLKTEPANDDNGKRRKQLSSLQSLQK